MLQDSCSLHSQRSTTKSPSSRKMVIKAKELEASKAVECKCDLVGKEPSSKGLPSKFANFSPFMGKDLQRRSTPF